MHRAIIVVAGYKQIDIATAVLAFFLTNLLFFLILYILAKVSTIIVIDVYVANSCLYPGNYLEYRQPSIALLNFIVFWILAKVSVGEFNLAVRS